MQGASQAVEDGTTLAVVLQLAHTLHQPVPLAVRAWEKIRYQRVRRAQLTGESVRNKWHSVTTERGKDVELPRPRWLLGFDAEEHAYQVYEDVAKEIEEKGYELPVLPPPMPVEDA